MARRTSAERAPRFRSSREAYHWIMWDGGFTPGDFVIAYDDHDDMLREIALESFEPGGEIPWHRIWSIRMGEQTVWDRELKVDRLADVRRDPTEAAPRRGSATRVRAPRSRSTFMCPHCAEVVDTAPDPGAGAHQSYLEDCPVCCRPNRIEATWSDANGEYVVQAAADD